MDKNLYKILRTECMRQGIYVQISDFKWLDSCFFFPFWRKRALLIMCFRLIWNHFPVSWCRWVVRSMKSVEATAGSNTLTWSDEFSIPAFPLQTLDSNLVFQSQAKQPYTTSWCLHAKRPNNPKTSANHCTNLIWVNSLFKGNQNGKTSLDIFPSEKSNLYKLVEWHTWCGMHASLYAV